MNIEPIFDAGPDELAAIFEAALMRLGELGRDGGDAVRGRLKGHEEWNVEEGLSQIEELFA